MALQKKAPMWTLDKALELVRTLQPQTRDYNYHLTLGGGVLNTGESRKDLDLYFHPMDNDKDQKEDGLLDWLARTFGPYELLDDPAYGPSTHYAHKLKFHVAVLNNARIDVFVTR